MAFPGIPTVAGGRVLTNTQANTTATRTFPSLSSLTKNSGDLLIAIIVAYQGAGTDAQFSSWGGSFTEFHDTATTTTMAMGAAYKWSTGSETGTFSVTQADTVVGHAAMILLSISGAHASTPPEAGSRASGTTTEANPGTFDPAGWGAEDTLWIAVGGNGETSTTGSWTGIVSAPGNFTDYVDTGVSNDVTGAVEGAVSFRQQNASTQDVALYTLDLSNARNAAFVIAVRPRAIVTHDRTGSATTAVTTTATGKRKALRTGSSSVAITTTATGLHTGRRTGSSGLTVTATATGKATHFGQGSATVSVTSTATGKPTHKGQASSSLVITATATGVRTAQRTGTATAVITATATGKPTHKGQGSASLVVTTTATGEKSTPGEVSGSAGITITATATGRATRKGQGSATLHITATASGAVVIEEEFVHRRFQTTRGRSYDTTSTQRSPNPNITRSKSTESSSKSYNARSRT